MVRRKSSLPYPSSPPVPQANTQSNPVISSQNELLVDSADLPPVPRPTHLPTNMNNSPFEDRGNPWIDVPSAQGLRSDRPLPDILKPRNGRPAEFNTQGASAEIPTILKAGNSNQHTPRSSSESQRSKDFWEDDEDEEAEVAGKERNDNSATAPPIGLGNNLDAFAPTVAGDRSDDPIVKRKPVASNLQNQSQQDILYPPPGFASNNPFRRTSSADSSHAQQEPSHTVDNIVSGGWNQNNFNPKGKGKGKEFTHDPYNPPTDSFSRMRLGNDERFTSSSTTDMNRNSKASEYNSQVNDENRNPPPPQGPPPPIPQVLSSPFTEQPPLIPVSTEVQHDVNPWSSQPALPSTPSPIFSDQSQKVTSTYNNDLLDRGQQAGVIKLGQKLKTVPAAGETSARVQPQASLLDDDDIAQALPPRNNISRSSSDELEMYDAPEGPPPQKPPRPNVLINPPSDADVARMVEKRNETYQIKQFNWFDHGSGRLRRSSMLVQNENGPCPLLAIVNALILGAKDESQATLDEALRSREQVSLGLIIETLMDELLSRGYNVDAEPLPDVDELNGFLMRLRTGMNANPRFIAPSMPAPNIMDARNSMLHLPRDDNVRFKTGTFESTPDMKLYGAFSVPLMHGWLPEPGSSAARAFERSAQTYEDAMAVQFGEEELEYKLTRNGLSPEEQEMWQDIVSIKDFLKQYPTQLTPYGLESVQDALSSGSFAIMFRNDHFSTLYKHPESGQLFTLITDAGYADRDEVIWESLVDINGKHTEFFSGDFMPVSHNMPANAHDDDHFEQQGSSQQLGIDANTAPLSPQERQEQHDADFAMALQLQEEEEQRQRAEQSRRRSGNNRPSTGNIPIPLRSQQEARPIIPPRNSRSQNPGVTRPSDAADEDAPPAYEIAAKGKPYIPPVGSPLHPSAEPSPMSSNTQLAGTISNTSTSGPSHPPGQPPGPNAGVARRQPARRMSAYNENGQHHGGGGPADQRMGHGMNPMYHASGGGVGAGIPMNRPGKVPPQERDCVVM